MKPKHQPCPCGCGEMADECMNPGNPNPFSAFTITFTGSSKATRCERCGETDPVMMNERLCDACESTHIVRDMTQAAIQAFTEHVTWREAERILHDEDSGKSNHP